MTSVEELEDRFRKAKEIPDAVVVAQATYLYGVKCPIMDRKSEYMTAAKNMALRLKEEMQFPGDPKPDSGKLGHKFKPYRLMIEELVYLTEVVNGRPKA